MRENMDATPTSLRQDQRFRDGWPFFVILTVVIVAMYVWSITSTPSLSAPARLIPFTLLCALHAGLYWISPRLARRHRIQALYLILQGGIIFVIATLSENLGVVAGLYMGISGIAVGLLEDIRLSAIPLVGYMALASLNYYVAWGVESLSIFISLYIAVLLFVMVYIIMFGLQSSERDKAKQLLADLEQAHTKLGEYASQVEDLTIAAERQRMARELHDTLAQGLAGLILQLEAVDSHLVRGQAGEAGNIVRQAMDRARTTLAEARRAIADLRSEGLIENDLVESVRKEVARFQSASGIAVSTSYSRLPEIPASVREHAFRAIREGLTNIAGHAQAENVNLHVGMGANGLEVILKDDGVGFDAEQSLARGGHYGLIGLRERARLVGGSLDVESHPGEGTILILRIPMRDDEPV